MSGDDLFWAKYNLSGALGREEGLKARIAELEKELAGIHEAHATYEQAWLAYDRAVAKRIGAKKAYVHPASTIGSAPTKEKEA